MKQSMAQIVERLQVVSDVSSREHEEIDALYPGGIRSTAEATLISQNEPRPADAALRAYVSALPTFVLAAIEALLYLGRDGGNLHAIMVDCCTGMGVRGGAVDTICSKRPRMDYIRTGVERLGRTSLHELLEDVKSRLATLGTGLTSA